MRKVLAMIVLVSIVIAGTASAGSSDPEATAAKSRQEKAAQQLRDAVKGRKIFERLKKLNGIARANDGTRTAGTAGYDQSVDYVARSLRRFGWKVERQPFDFVKYSKDGPSAFERTAPDPTAYQEGTDFSTMEYSGSGEVTAELVAVDLALPPPAEPGVTSGCEASDFDGLDVTGKVALMQRGSCGFGDKAANAAAAGAGGAVIFNEGQPGRTDVVEGTLGEPVQIPVLGTSFAIGSDLAAGTLDGATGTTVHVRTETSFEEIASENVIAETRRGNRNKVVMAGAHLDSVAAGPGINDNGSGSAALLELARQIDRTGLKPKNRLRFAWWGAEEEGLIGSTSYVEALGAKQAAKIALYLNFDMLGSPNFARLTYDGNQSQFEEADPPPGSAAIERTFSRYFQSQDLPTGQTAFDGRSDYGPFIDIGIPAGGLFSGAEEIKSEADRDAYGGTAGEAYDPCYHKACDDVENVSRRSLRQLSNGVAHAVGYYSAKLSFIPPRERRLRERSRALRRDTIATDYLGDSLRR